MDDRNRLNILTLNIGSPSVKRAERQLEWLGDRDDDILVLTETCGTAGSELIAGRLTAAGWQVRFPSLSEGQRGVLVAGRVRTHAAADPLVSYLPGRAEVVTIAGADVDVIGVYVPSRDESDAKTARKSRFTAELSRALRSRAGRPTVLLGDLNVVEPDHRPRYPVFRDWEYALYTGLIEDGWVDVYRQHRVGPIEHSWVGPDDDGFRYDHVFASAPIDNAVLSCSMIHETREQRLTDHSALTMSLACGTFERLDVEASLSSDPLALF